MSARYDNVYEDYPTGLRVMLHSMLNVVGFGSPYDLDCSSSPELSPVRRRSVSPGCRKGEVEVLPFQRFNGRQGSYSQEADKNAQELIKQEEQAKLKAEKKKAKKLRQKGKKKEHNEDSSVNNSEKINSLNTDSNDIEKIPLNTDNKEAEEIDINAAFVNNAVKQLKIKSVIPVTTKKKDKIIDESSLIKTALDYENKEHYKEAIQYLSDAINLSPKACDLILKRSFVYYKLAKFKKSVRDAEKVLEYDPNSIEGHYRLGEGHFAMNNIFEAEAAFKKLLSLNAYIDEASKRLFSIRLKQLQEMGYHPNEAFTALLKSKNKTLDEAIEYLTDLENGKVETDDVYYSDEEDSEEDYDQEEEGGDIDVASGPLVEPAPKPNIVLDKKSPLFTDPSNPTQCCSLFVGNLKKNITYKEVEDVFIKFGDIESIKLTTETTCYGFVNYKESGSAGCAMEALQGSRWLLSTVPLIIRYPNKATISSLSKIKNPELILNKFAAPKPARLPRPAYKPSPVKPSVKQPIPYKPTGFIGVKKKSLAGKPPCTPEPEDCYFWRTTGCVYGNKCFNLHRPELKGVALNHNKPAANI